MPNMQGYRLRSEAMGRLANTLENIPQTMSQNWLREKQFDIDAAMTKRRLESSALQDRLTGLKIDAQDMANQDVKDERERLKQPIDFASGLDNISTSQHYLYPVGKNEDGSPRVVMDNLLQSIGAMPEVDEKTGTLRGKLPDGSYVTGEYMQRRAPQFNAALLAHTDPHKAMIEGVRRIDREAQKAGGLTPEMAAERKQILQRMEDPVYLLDAELKNLAVVSAINAPGTEAAIERKMQKVEEYKKAILNRAETEGKRAEAQALIDLRTAQAAYYNAQTKGEIEKHNISEKSGGKINSGVAMENIKSLNKQIEEVNKSLVSNTVNLQGEVVPLPDEMREQYRNRLQELYLERKQWTELMSGLKIADEKPTVKETDWAKMTAPQQSGTIRDAAALASDLKDRGQTPDQIFAVLKEKYPEKALPAIIQYLDVKSRRRDAKPEEEPVKAEKPSKPVSAKDMAGTGKKAAAPAPEPKQDQGQGGFPEDSLIGRIRKNPAAYHPRQISFMTRYGDYHGFLDMQEDEAARHIKEMGKKNNIPENVIENDIQWLKSIMEGK